MRLLRTNPRRTLDLAAQLRAAEARLPTRIETRSLEQAEAVLTAIAELADPGDDGYRRQVQAAAAAVGKVIARQPESAARSWFRSEVNDHKFFLKKLVRGPH